MGEVGSPSSSAVITGAFRVMGLKAEQFKSPRKKRRAGTVEADGTIYYDGNDFLGSDSLTVPLCVYLSGRDNLEFIEDQKYDLSCTD